MVDPFQNDRSYQQNENGPSPSQLILEYRVGLISIANYIEKLKHVHYQAN